MDDIAAAAGVGKGTLFRRFGSRAGLMMVLLDEDEKASNRPSCSVRRRWDRARRRSIGCWPSAASDCASSAHHRALLSDANRDPQTRYNAAADAAPHARPDAAGRRGTTGDLDAQTDALLALLDADYVTTSSTIAATPSRSRATRGKALARKLCGR